MQNFLSRLIGRLNVGRKLALIYLLDLTAVIFVSGILINEKYIAIDFTDKEIAGAAYIDAIRASLTPLAGARPSAQAMEAAAREIDAAEARHGMGMSSAKLARDYADALRHGPDHAFDRGRLLLTRVGNQSNLILDPDLDSYYTMSLAVLRFPELLELLRTTPNPNAAHDMALLQGRLDAAANGIASDYREALAAGDGTLAQRLNPSRQALQEALQRYQAGPMDFAQRGAAIAALNDAWRVAQEELSRLLHARQQAAYVRMAEHFGTAVLLLLVILSVVFYVARQITAPLRQLAGVAADVSRSGNYALRAAWKSGDEIGQLVAGFNAMLQQLDRHRLEQQELVARHHADNAQKRLAEAIPMPLLVTAIPDHEVLHANAAAQSWLRGRGDPWSSGMDAPTRARFFQSLADLGAVDEFEVRWLAGSQPSWALVSARRIEYGGRAAVLSTFTPINRMKAMEQYLELWAKVFEAASEGILLIDAEGRIVEANAAFCRSANLDVDDLTGMHPRDLLDARNDVRLYQTMLDTAARQGAWQGEAWIQRRGREPWPAWLSLNAARDKSGDVAHHIAIVTDISERKKNEERIRYMAHHDALTGLPNRLLCRERLQMSIAQSQRAGSRVAVLFVDLDRFKNINDSLGHHVGDALLSSVAQRLSASVRPGDTVSRLGGDEFIVILNNVADVEEIGKIAKGRLIEAIRQPYPLGGAELHISCSVGAAVYPDDGEDIDALMRHADAAMYQAKNSGRDNLQFFTAELNERVTQRLLLENDLRHAVARGELLLHYQPRIDAATLALAGVESLVRWQHPTRGLVGPAEFIPIAEESGLIVDIGAWIIDEACRQHAQWRERGLGTVPVSINLSAVQLRDNGLCDTLRGALRRHAIDAAQIELELTESILMDNGDAAIARLNAIKALGVSLSIDDFGTGYSSLNYLYRFPVDKLKIDRSFIQNMAAAPQNLALIHAIIGLGHTLGRQVVAEGVSQESEARILRDCGCDELQGFHFSRPLPALEVEGWMRDRRARAA